MTPATRLKDEQLARLSAGNNVAQFTSFGPGPEPIPRYQRIRGFDNSLTSVEQAVAAMLSVAPSCNVRTFRSPPVKNSPFHYGLTDAREMAALVRKYSAQDYYTIINETIDINDGGVSGVALGGIIEFAPQDTPRAVERTGVVAASYDLAMRLLNIVYRFTPRIPRSLNQRIEFSIHPERVGYRRSHTLLWELEKIDSVQLTARPNWPNRFSRFIGDKAFGLLIAHILGLPVPRTVVIPRQVAPFIFGKATAQSERWMRTCPREPAPGKFTTTTRWSDPFQILAEEDPTGEEIASILSQDAIAAAYSGATLPMSDGTNRVEGVIGRGDLFMQGRKSPDQLPSKIIGDVVDLLTQLSRSLGPCRVEWVHDGNTAWILQLHLMPSASDRGILSSGHADRWYRYDPSEGLDRLRDLVEKARRSDAGVLVAEKVGITSHVGDILRRAHVPGRFRDLQRISDDD